jgi:hypothetical protein
LYAYLDVLFEKENSSVIYHPTDLFYVENGQQLNIDVIHQAGNNYRFKMVKNGSLYAFTVDRGENMYDPTSFLSITEERKRKIQLI